MSRHRGGVNIGKLLEQEERRYKLPPLDTYIVEAGMNSFSNQYGEASILRYKIISDGKYDKTLQITDNGRGMNPKQFEQYHKCYSSTSKDTIGDINFVGMGIKSIIKRVHDIFTETKTKENHLASRWWYNPDIEDTEWDDVYDFDSNIKSETGTCITPNLKEKEDKEALTKEKIVSIVQNEMMGILLGEYGDKRIFVEEDGIETEIKSKYPHPTEYVNHRIRSMDSIGEYNGGHYPPKCMFFYSPETLPDEDCGIWIIVGKKTICRQDDWFRQFPKEQRNHIRGYIIADYLIDIVNTGKDDFREGKRYRDFYAEASKEWGKFLEFVEIDIEKPIVDEGTIKIVDKVAKELGELIGKTWDKIDLTINKRKEGVIVPPLPKRKCPICASTNLKTSETDESMYVCLNCGHVFEKRWSGHREGKKKGIIFEYDENPSEAYKYIPAWWIFSDRVIVINVTVSTWKSAEKISGKTLEFYVKEIALRALIEDSDIENKQEVYYNYFKDYR